MKEFFVSNEENDQIVQKIFTILVKPAHLNFSSSINFSL